MLNLTEPAPVDKLVPAARKRSMIRGVRSCSSASLPSAPPSCAPPQTAASSSPSCHSRNLSCPGYSSPRESSFVRCFWSRMRGPRRRLACRCSRWRLGRPKRSQKAAPSLLEKWYGYSIYPPRKRVRLDKLLHELRFEQNLIDRHCLLSGNASVMNAWPWPAGPESKPRAKNVPEKDFLHTLRSVFILSWLVRIHKGKNQLLKALRIRDCVTK